MAAPPIWALGHHQCRFHDYTNEQVSAVGRGVPRPGHPLRRALARHRLHGWISRLHLASGAVPRRAALPRRAEGESLPPGHDRGPRREGRAGLPGVRRGARPQPALQDGGGQALHRQGLAGPHGVSGLREAGGPRLVGLARRPARRLGRGGHLERHERARHGRRRAVQHALRSRRRGSPSRALPQPVRPAHGQGDVRGARRGAARPPPIHSQPRGIRRHPALRGAVARRQLLELGAPRDERPDDARHGDLGAAVRGRRHPWVRLHAEPGAGRAVDPVRRAHALLPEPQPPGRARPVPVVVRRGGGGDVPRGAPAPLSLAALPLQRVRPGERVGRPRRAAAPLRFPARSPGARDRGRLPARGGAARRPGLRARLHHAPGLPPRGDVGGLAHGRASRRRTGHRRPGAARSDPAVRPRRLHRPLLCVGAGVDDGPRRS